MKQKGRAILLVILTTLSGIALYAQRETVKPIPYGDMNNWMVRSIKESFVIGSNTRYVYEIVKGDTLFDNTPYKNTASPWATSSVLATVKGVTKASVTVFPEKRDTGYAARLETRIENVKVFGIININVLASGTIFLGEMVEPITDTSNPNSKLVSGVPFAKRPDFLQYDYKVITGGKNIKATGFGRQSKLAINDMAEINILLQHRWEDAEGKVFAKRVATGWERYSTTQNTWQNKHRMPIHYGDISKESHYKPYMGLRTEEMTQYTRNSKGKMTPIQETAWATANEPVTHMILQFSSSNGGAYIGNTDSKLWIDNVELVYTE